MGEPTDVIAALNAKVARLEHDLAEALTGQAQKIADGIAAGMAEVQSIVDVCREQDAEHGRVVGENHRLNQQVTRLAGFVKGHVPEDLEGDTERAVRWLTQYAARLEGERDRLDRAYEEAASALMAAREKQGLAKAKLTYQRQDFDRTLHEVMTAASVVIERHTNMIEQAYGIIACAWNVGNPPVEPVPGWNAAVFEFQERYHAWLKGRISS